MIKIIKSQLGVSIIEIVLGLLIVGMIILLFVNLPMALGLIGVSSHEGVAKEIVLKKIEDLRRQGYDNLANGTSPILDGRLSSLPLASAQTVVSDCASPICNNGELTKQVDITINWTDSNKGQNVAISTLISKGGLP